MIPTIVEVHPAGPGFTIHLSEPRHIPEAWQSRPFPYSTTDPIPAAFQAGAGRVDEIGGYMMDALSQHPAVKQAIEQQLSGGEDATRPLLVRVPIEAESLPWETLFANGSFLALDRRWPIARLSPGDGEKSVKDFQPPLRILAVLAADEKVTDTDDASEWRALLQSLEAAAFPVVVKALVAQDALRDEINATRSRTVTAEADFVPPGRRLVQEIGSYKPHILHFFCHGLSVNGTSTLQIGTRLFVKQAGSPVHFRPNDIQQSLASDLWLVTLNCCESAQSNDGVGSFAFTLVSQGVPAVAGMRKPVSATNANTFTRGFYRALIQELGAVLKQLDQDVEIDWPAMLHEPRMDLAEANRGPDPLPTAAQSCWAWTLPALYLGWRSHQLVGRPPAADTRPIGPVVSKVPSRLLGLLGLRGETGPVLSAEQRAYAQAKLELLRELVRLQLGAPQEVLDEYRAEIEELERQLYGSTSPPLDGNQ
jgi:hypothetical protein